MFGFSKPTTTPMPVRRQLSGRVLRIGVYGFLEVFGGYTILVEGHKKPFRLSGNRLSWKRDTQEDFQYVELTQAGDMISFTANATNEIMEFKNAALDTFTYSK